MGITLSICHWRETNTAEIQYKPPPQRPRNLQLPATFTLCLYSDPMYWSLFFEIPPGSLLHTHHQKVLGLVVTFPLDDPYGAVEKSLT